MDEDVDLVEYEASVSSPESGSLNVIQFLPLPSTQKETEISCKNLNQQDQQTCSEADHYSKQAELSVVTDADISDAETPEDGSIKRTNSNTNEEEDGYDMDTALSLLATDKAVSRGDLLLPLQRLMLRVRKLGCIVDAVQVKCTRRKLKCSVDACSYRGPNPESIGFRCTLPSAIEIAAQWICICVVDVSRQNTLLIKLINSLRDEGENAERSHVMPISSISRKKLLDFPFRICSRHFSTKITDTSVSVVPDINLPERSMIFYEELLPRLRRRYVFLSETGYEDIDIDKLEPNGILISPYANPLPCDVPERLGPNCSLICISDNYKMVDYATTFADYGRWHKAIQNGIGLPSTFEFHLPEAGHVCEMHFSEGKRYTRGVMQDPSVFRKLSVEGVNPKLSQLGPVCLTTCAIATCSNAVIDTVCVPFPKPDDDLYHRWIDALAIDDESNETKFICLRHFSLSREEGLVPIICLNGEAKLDFCGDQRLKRRHENIEEEVKKNRLDAQENAPDLYPTNNGGERSEQEKSCCVESRRIGETVEQIEMKARVVERVVAQLQITCKNHYDNKGEFNHYMKFQLFDILSELRSQKGVVHSLRQRLEDSVKDPDKLRWAID